MITLLILLILVALIVLFVLCVIGVIAGAFSGIILIAIDILVAVLVIEFVYKLIKWLTK